MEQSVDLAALERETGQIDPEVFRRVWARVMPDQSHSPLVVQGAPMPGKGPGTAHPAAPVKGRGTPSSPTPGAGRRMNQSQAPMVGKGMPTAPPAEEPGRALGQLMDLAREGAEQSAALARRAGNRERGLSALAEDHRQGLRRLSALYFLTTGQHRQPRAAPPVTTSPLDLALREQFLWEGRWRAACLEAAEQDPESAGELCRELAQEAELHRRIIRGILERM